VTPETIRLPGSDLIPRPGQARSVPIPADASKRRLFAFENRDLRSRPFNLMRSRLLKIVQSENWRLFGISSAQPGAGKSFVASNLAAALARAPDQEVYLFDLDLRRGSLADYFGLEVETGLEQFLAGDIPDLLGVARRIGDEPLVVSPCRPSRRSSTELIGGRPMKRLAEAMRGLRGNAVCICDLPPVFASDDASEVTALLDAYFLVIEEGVTTKQQVRDAMNLMAPAVCAGTILNRHTTGLFEDSYGYGRKQAYVYGSYYDGEREP
jgi:protein-tyrosine kinase